MDEEIKKQTYKTIRRVNLTRNSRGMSYECTVEMIDVDNEEVVRQATELRKKIETAIG